MVFVGFMLGSTMIGSDLWALLKHMAFTLSMLNSEKSYIELLLEAYQVHVKGFNYWAMTMFSA